MNTSVFAVILVLSLAQAEPIGPPKGTGVDIPAAERTLMVSDTNEPMMPSRPAGLVILDDYPTLLDYLRHVKPTPEDISAHILVWLGNRYLNDAPVEVIALYARLAAPFHVAIKVRDHKHAQALLKEIKRQEKILGPVPGPRKQ